jgi:hypothetical protein
MLPTIDLLAKNGGSLISTNGLLRPKIAPLPKEALLNAFPGQNFNFCLESYRTREYH